MIFFQTWMLLTHWLFSCEVWVYCCWLQDILFQIRRAVRNIRKTLPEIANVLVLLLLMIALFTLLGSKLFGKRYKYESSKMTMGSSSWMCFWLKHYSYIVFFCPGVQIICQWTVWVGLAIVLLDVQWPHGYSVLISRSSSPGWSPGQGHCGNVFLGKTLYSHSASLHPWVPVNLMLGGTLQWST